TSRHDRGQSRSRRKCSRAGCQNGAPREGTATSPTIRRSRHLRLRSSPPGLTAALRRRKRTKSPRRRSLRRSSPASLLLRPIRPFARSLLAAMSSPQQASFSRSVPRWTRPPPRELPYCCPTEASKSSHGSVTSPRSTRRPIGFGTHSFFRVEAGFASKHPAPARCNSLSLADLLRPPDADHERHGRDDSPTLKLQPEFVQARRRHERLERDDGTPRCGLFRVNGV